MSGKYFCRISTTSILSLSLCLPFYAYALAPNEQDEEAGVPMEDVQRF